MNGLRRDGLDRARALAARARGAADRGAELVICPPATLLAEVRAALAGSGVGLGAQDCAARPSGAHTGDIGAPMLADAGCDYVILGHSERRAEHAESSELVRAKVGCAHDAGLVAIVCVGESARQRDAGRAREVVETELDASLPDDVTAGNTVVAYEPVWAIGSGRTPGEAEIAEMQGGLRERLCARFGPEGAGIRLLYGGSVNPANAAGILGAANVDGALVGGASLAPDDFWAVCEAGG